MTAAEFSLDAPRERPRLRVSLAIAGAIFCLAVIAVGAFALLNLAARHAFRTTVRYSNVKSLAIEDGAGDVSLTTAPAGAPLTVKEAVTEGLAKPSVRVTRGTGGALTVKADCPGVFECSVRLQLEVPTTMAVSVHSNFGTITASELTSTASIDLNSGTGDLTATGLSAPSISLKSSLGDIKAQLIRPAHRLVARSGTGDVTLFVPDTTYTVHASSGTGTVSDHDLRTDPRSPRSIEASSSLGNVTIALDR